jgi:plastocyanin domain-containing protein
MRHLLLSAFALSALALVGCNKNDGASAAAAGGAVPVMVDGDGFKPSSVKFKKGDTAKLVFTRTTDETCAKEVVFPDLNLKKDLPKNTPVTIDIPTDKEQSLTFQCGMGMYKSSVVIAAK